MEILQYQNQKISFFITVFFFFHKFHPSKYLCISLIVNQRQEKPFSQRNLFQRFKDLLSTLLRSAGRIVGASNKMVSNISLGILRSDFKFCGNQIFLSFLQNKMPVEYWCQNHQLVPLRISGIEPHMRNCLISLTYIH